MNAINKQGFIYNCIYELFNIILLFYLEKAN